MWQLESNQPFDLTLCLAALYQRGNRTHATFLIFAFITNSYDLKISSKHLFLILNSYPFLQGQSLFLLTFISLINVST